MREIRSENLTADSSASLRNDNQKNQDVLLELVEHEEGSPDEAAEGYGVVPVELVAEVKD